jgi:hypothetical protein
MNTVARFAELRHGEVIKQYLATWYNLQSSAVFKIADLEQRVTKRPASKLQKKLRIFVSSGNHHQINVKLVKFKVI